MHCGYVVKVEHLRKHENADRLQIATFFGNDTVVSLDTKVGDVGVYFPADLQLSSEYCDANNLVRKKNSEGKDIGGYLDPEKRNIKSIKLRGEKSDGVYMPITSFDYCFATKVEVIEGQPWKVIEGQPASDYLKVGENITVVNGHEICQKYIPRSNQRHGKVSTGNKTRKHKEPYAPLFTEHADTEQLAYNMGAFKVGDEIEITLKMHGTSQRTGYLPIISKYKKTWKDKLFRKEGTPVYDYGYVSGTRRVVLENFDGNGFYGSNAFRQQHHDAFVGKLMKGETVYYEVVGFTDTGASIMANGNNEKLGKDFVKQYGKETVFSYGCTPDAVIRKMVYGEDEHGSFAMPVETVNNKQSDVYVYRMTMTNEDGFTVEYTPDFMRYRCEQMGVKTVPVFTRFTIPDFYQLPDGVGSLQAVDPGEYVKTVAEKFYSGPDPVGKTHTREGVVVRIINRPKFCAYKHKCYEFKMLEGLIKETAEVPDMEEAQDVTSEF